MVREWPQTAGWGDEEWAARPKGDQQKVALRDNCGNKPQ